MYCRDADETGSAKASSIGDGHFRWTARDEMDRLDAMRILLTVVDAGSLSAGSRVLNMPLTTVSRKVAELERRLGARLLIRTSRKIQLTDAGRDYVDAVRQAITQLDDADRRAAGEYDQPRGELTVTVPSEFGRLVVVPLIWRFLEKYPDISLEVLALERHVDFVEERVDVGLRLGELADSALYAVKLGKLAISTCASPAYLDRRGCPTHPADLSEHDGILYRYPGAATWAYSVDGTEVECTPRFRVRANTGSISTAAAIEGFGIARLFEFQVHQEFKAGRLVRLFEEYETASVPVHLVYVNQGLLPIKVRAFLDWMTPQLKMALKELNSRD